MRDDRPAPRRVFPAPMARFAERDEVLKAVHGLVVRAELAPRDEVMDIEGRRRPRHAAVLTRVGVTRTRTSRLFLPVRSVDAIPPAPGQRMLRGGATAAVVAAGAGTELPLAAVIAAGRLARRARENLRHSAAAAHEHNGWLVCAAASCHAVSPRSGRAGNRAIARPAASGLTGRAIDGGAALPAWLGHAPRRGAEAWHVGALAHVLGPGPAARCERRRAAAGARPGAEAQTIRRGLGHGDGDGDGTDGLPWDLRPGLLVRDGAALLVLDGEPGVGEADAVGRMKHAGDLMLAAARAAAVGGRGRADEDGGEHDGAAGDEPGPFRYPVHGVTSWEILSADCWAGMRAVTPSQ